MTLLDDLRAMISLEGPLSVERFMRLCLEHPVHGYYTTRDPFGTRGDFTTAPEISQMFGEMLGLWAAEVWGEIAEPARVLVVELGPGRGSLMADLLRTARVRPGFLQALSVHLVETSPFLERVQRERLRESPAPVHWHARLGDVPAGPAIVIANEFFDALPIRQYVATERGWCERLVGLGADGALVFGLSAEAKMPPSPRAHPGAVRERSHAAVAVATELATRLAAQGGAALLIDYGYEGPAVGDTLQAVRGHGFVHPLVCPGDSDLTAHVDFGALGVAGRAGGAKILGPADQCDFLQALGIETRATTLKRRATTEQAQAIDAALVRLIGRGPQDMGSLFKVLGMAEPKFSHLPGFAA